MIIQDRIVKFLNKNPRWFRKAELIEIAVNNGMNGDTVGREARLAFEAGRIQRKDYIQKNKKKGAMYASLSVEKPKEPTKQIIERDGVRIMVIQ